MESKKYLVNVDLKVSISIPEHYDPEMDPEFDEAVVAAVKKRLEEEGPSFIIEGISDYEEDENGKRYRVDNILFPPASPAPTSSFSPLPFPAPVPGPSKPLLRSSTHRRARLR